MATISGETEQLAMAKEIEAVEVPVVLRERSKRRSTQVVGVIDAGSLTAHYTIPRRDHRRKEGYQREITQSRVNRLVSDLRANRVDLPTAVLVNIRDFDADRHLREHKGQLFLRLEGDPLYVVDGQHRVAALDKLIHDDPDRWSSFQVPFACLLGATERQEMEEFYVVNSTAKSVRTDLAYDLLKQRAESDPDIYEGLVERKEDWKVQAQALTEALSDAPLWKGRIRFPGEPKAGTTVGSNGMVNSIKQLLATPYFGHLSQQNQLRILEAYWESIARILPECFRDAEHHALQKSTGVQVMHAVLVPVLEILRSEGHSVVDDEAYVEILQEPLTQLEGDTTSGHIAHGAEFWRSGSEGAAGSYSSNAGRRVLTNRIKHALPEVEIDL